MKKFNTFQSTGGLSIFLILLFSLSVFISTLQAGEIKDSIPVEVKYPNIVIPHLQFGSFGSMAGQLNTPIAVAINAQNELFIVERCNARISVFSQSGKFLRTWGTHGNKAHELIDPKAIEISETGEVYITDVGTDMIKVFDQYGKLLRQWGSYGDTEGAFNNPRGITVSKGKVYVADKRNHRIQVFEESGKFLFAFGTYGYQKGKFLHPIDVVVSDAGDIFVCDSENNRIQKFDAKGKFIKSFGSYGSYGGLLVTPTDMVYSDGEILVTDLINHRMQAFDEDGKYTYQWGRHPTINHEGNGRTHYPMALAISPDRNFVAICEPVEHRIQIFNKQDIDKISPVDDLAWWEKHAKFHYGTGVKAMSDILALVEEDTHMALLFDTKGDIPRLITKFGGYGREENSFIMPTGIYYDVDKSNILVSDAGNNRIQVFKYFPDRVDLSRKVNSKGDAPNKRAIQYLMSIGGKLGKAKEHFNDPGDLMIGPNGNLYVVDNGNNRIKIYDREYKVVKVVGEKGNGPGQFNEPYKIRHSPDGKYIYVLDGHNYRVQAFDLDMNYLFEWGGPGSEQGQFLYPYGLCVDKEGNVYVGDVGSHTIKKFNAKGEFILEYGGFGTDHGKFYKPKGLDQDWSDPKGRIYHADFGNHRGQIFSPKGEFIAVFGIGELQNSKRDVNVDPEAGGDETKPKSETPKGPGSMGTFRYVMLGAILLLLLVIAYLYSQNQKLKKR